MRYEDVVRAVGEALAGQLAVLLGGRFTDADAIVFGADATAAANIEAGTAAVLHYAGTMHATTGELAIPALPELGHHTDPRRLREAVATILDHRDPADAVGRFRRFALGETSEAAAAAYGDALRRDDRVTGWRRAMNSSACQLCRWWSRGGRVWPASYPMQRHTGCTCTQEPITADIVAEPSPVPYSRRARR